MSKKLPVLILAFNRPDLFERVLESVLEYGPSRLYISCDGPRNGNQDDVQNVEAIRQIVESLAADHQVSFQFHRANRGCFRGVKEGIDWFFDAEEAGIILEDDCLVTNHFFSFCEWAMHTYAKDARIGMVSGHCVVPQRLVPSQPAFLNRCVHIWGWATWRRTWSLFVDDLSLWRNEQCRELIFEFVDGSRFSEAYWSEVFDAMGRDAIDTWDFRWVYTLWKHQLLSLNSSTNLVTNIGFDSRATHTTDPGSRWSRQEIGSFTYSSINQTPVTRSLRAEKWTDVHVYGARKFYIKKTILRIPGFKMCLMLVRKLVRK